MEGLGAIVDPGSRDGAVPVYRDLQIVAGFIASLTGAAEIMLFITDPLLSGFTSIRRSKAHF